MLWYYKLLAHRPHLILLFVGTLCVACIVVSLTSQTTSLPDFSDPTLGFEARGTTLGQRMTAWHNLLEETSPSGGQLIANPYEYLDDEEERDSRHNNKKRKHNAQRHRKRKKNKNKGSLVLTEKIQVLKTAASGKANANAIDLEEQESNAAVWVENGTRRGDMAEESQWEYGRNVSFIDDDDEVQNKSIQEKKENWMKLTKMQPPPFQTDIHTSSDGFFCESPSRL